jgi:hypothetical protein
VFVPPGGWATSLSRIRWRGRSLTPRPRCRNYWVDAASSPLLHRTMACSGAVVGNVDYQRGQSLALIGVRVGKAYRDSLADQPVAFARRFHELGPIEDRDLPSTVLY